MLNHVSFIMDGNRRWAKNSNLSAREGHEAGLHNMMKIIDYCAELKIKYASFYSFSQENWFRSLKEIYGMFFLIEKYGEKMIQKWVNSNINVRVMGDKENLPSKIVDWIEKLENSTANCTGLSVMLMVNYSGRYDILQAVNKIIQSDTKVVNEKILEKHLCTGGIPNPDLCIRTGSESRLSNFFLWQIAYSEIAFVDVFWPDFSNEMLRGLLEKHENKDRRFGI